MAGLGGRRQNAGRKKGGHNKATIEIKTILSRVVDWDIVIGKLYELVQGVSVREFDKKGEAHIYDKSPDAFSAKILLEYGFGKAPQPLTNVTGESFLVKLDK